MPDPIAGVLRKPFAEQIAAFRLRLGDLVPTTRWDDISRQAHDRAFIVAGATKADLLSDLAGAVDKAIAEGTGLEAFRRDFRQIVERHGWHGWTGEDSAAGRAWRTRVIYRTNMSTTYAAGRLAQLREGKFAFWVYRHGASREPRIVHLSWNGLVLAPDHAFWAAHYPPSDWGCSCYVIGARSEAGARRVGGDPGKPLPDNWNKIDPKTGAPVGVGKGWDYAPGATVAHLIPALRDKLDQLPDRPAIDLIQNWLTDRIFGEWLRNPSGSFPLVRLAEATAARIGARKTVADMSAETALKQLRRHPELTVFDYAEVQRVVSHATRVIQDGPSSLVFLLEPTDANGHLLVVKASNSGEGLFVTSFRRISGDKATRDRLIRQYQRREGK